MIIAIDGPAASGKGTLARRVAEHFGLHYLDTGLLYRAVARDVLARGFRLDDTWAVVAMARSLDPATLDDAGLRAPASARRPHALQESRKSVPPSSIISADWRRCRPALFSTGVTSARWSAPAPTPRSL